MSGTDQLSAVFSALADPTRRAILAELADRDATVTELTAPLPISMPAVSRHLKALERAGLISRTRSGKLRDESHRGRPAARSGRLDRALPPALGHVPHPPRRPPRRRAGRRTRNGPDGPDRPRAGSRQGELMDSDNPAARHLARVRRATGARLPSFHRSRTTWPHGGARSATQCPATRWSSTSGPAATSGGPRSSRPNPAFASTSTSTSPTSPTANCSTASCTSPASCRRASSRSRRGCGSSSTTRPTDGRDSRSASGSPGIWRAPADQGWNEAFTKLDATLRNAQPVAVDIEV